MASKIPGSGPLPQEQARYARKLVGADLDAEQARAKALLAEAKAERAKRPAKADQLAVRAESRLALIQAERKERGKLATRPEVETFAEGLEAASEAELADHERSLTKTRAMDPDADLKLMALARERKRRTSATEVRKAQAEKSRLDAVKKDYLSDLGDMSGQDLRMEQALEGVRLDAAQGKVSAAKKRLEQAQGAGAKKQAQAAVAAAEQQLRTEYARNAAVNAHGPASLDRKALKSFQQSITGQSPEALKARRSQVDAELKTLTTGGLRGSRAEVALKQAQLAAIDKRLAGPGKADPTTGVSQPKDDHPTAGAQVWKEPGMWVWNADAFPGPVAVEKLKANGVKWVALQIGDGTTLNSQALHQLECGFMDQMRAAGIKVGFWGVNRKDPEGEARLMAEQVKKYGADFYIANAEMEYKYTGPDGKPDPEAYGRSQRFVEAFRKELPDVAAGLSSYGRADMADIDWKVWRDAGFDWLPQAYLNDFDTCDPKLAVDGAVKAGWPKDRVHPTIGVWGGGQTRQVPVAEYAERLRAAGSVGFSSYLAEQTPESEWPAIGEMIRRGDISE